MPPTQRGSGAIGASDLTRTGDLLITSEMHYRLCYTSKLPCYYIRNTRECQQIYDEISRKINKLGIDKTRPVMYDNRADSAYGEVA